MKSHKVYCIYGSTYSFQSKYWVLNQSWLQSIFNSRNRCHTPPNRIYISCEINWLSLLLFFHVPTLLKIEYYDFQTLWDSWEYFPNQLFVILFCEHLSGLIRLLVLLYITFNTACSWLFNATNFCKNKKLVRLKLNSCFK